MFSRKPDPSWRDYQRELGKPRQRIVERAERTRGELEARRREVQGVVAGWSLIIVMVAALVMVAVKALVTFLHLVHVR